MHREPHPEIFVEALFATGIPWRQTKCSSAEKWKNKLYFLDVGMFLQQLK